MRCQGPVLSILGTFLDNAGLPVKCKLEFGVATLADFSGSFVRILDAIPAIILRYEMHGRSITGTNDWVELDASCRT